MLVTFYLSGPYSASTVASEFTIVGNPGAETFPGVLKAQLLTGHSVTFSESVTGGTVTATDATCEGTSVNWLVNPEPTPTPTPTVAQFTLSPAYGLTFGTITHNAGLVPEFTYPVSSNTSLDMISTYSSGSQFEVIASGTRPGGQTVNINIQKNGSVVGYVDLNSDPVGQQTYYITINQGFLTTDNLTISVGLGTGAF